MTTTLIRKADLSDLPTLSTVCSRTFIETYKGKGANRPDEMVYEYVRAKFDLESLEREFRSETVELWIATENDVPVGYFKITQEASPKLLGEYNLIHLERIYVLKSHHGKGLGKALLAKVEERSRELKKSGVWLGVWDENSAAVDFYNRNGFKKMGSQNWDFEYKGNLYRDNDDIMVKLNQTN